MLGRSDADSDGISGARIEALTKTLAIWWVHVPRLECLCFQRIQRLIILWVYSDEDLVNFSVQKREMDVLAKEWKRSDLMRETCEAELRKAREALR